MVRSDGINTGYMSANIIDGIQVPSAWPVHEQLKAVENAKSAVKKTPKAADKPKTVESVREKTTTKTKKEAPEPAKETVTPVKKKTSKKSEDLNKESEDSQKITKKTEPLEYRGVTAKTEHPKIPECLVDGGMLYRWLYDLRKTYIEEKVDKREIKIINEMMDYIIRMQKIEHL